MVRGKTKIKSSCDGFSLLEMAIVLLIVGIVLGAVFALLKPIVEGLRQLETKEKLAKISDVLNAYAVNNYRLPCPAIPDRTPGAGEPPFGFEDGSGANGDAIPDICARREGLLPFRVLGVPEDLARDGWGNYFTYAISPAFAQNTKAENPPGLHPVCRTRDWMYERGYDTDERLTFRNKNPVKARFCCPNAPAENNATQGDINLLDENDVFVLSVRRGLGNYPAGDPNELAHPPQPNGFPYTEDDMNTPEYYAAPQVPPPDVRATAVVYLLISHGRNGLGAYTGTAPAGRNAMPANTAEEYLNVDAADGADQARTYKEIVSAAAGGDGYDDIVLWRTQETVFAAEGESCVYP